MSQIDVASDPLLGSLVKAVLPKVAQAILGIGRSKMYDALGRGDLAAVKDGPRILITTESIARYQANRPPAVFAPPKPKDFEALARLNANHPRSRKRKAKAK